MRDHPACSSNTLARPSAQVATYLPGVVIESRTSPSHPGAGSPGAETAGAVRVGCSAKIEARLKVVPPHAAHSGSSPL